MARSVPRSNHRAATARMAPEACVARLSLYARELARLAHQRVGYVSSRRLAQQLGLTDTQVRRDLSTFGQFGTSGRGYEVQRLHDRLTAILGVSGRTWNVALAGAGNLGSALLAYRGFKERGFLFRLVVDADANKVGRVVQGHAVASAHDLTQIVRRHDIHIGVIAVPVEAAQAVCNQFVAGGVRAIVNFAPIHLDVPPTVWLRVVDLASELETLAFYLARTTKFETATP
ncbi:MAG: redox-sensing transcriptional repressor Rex [Candidatus Omnitrophica bacterium]|nr:redox-sensing transcriptional repressor Rex [Candidatus Omnitrophota bacterium]